MDTAIDLNMLADPGNRALFNLAAQATGNWSEPRPVGAPGLVHRSVMHDPAGEVAPLPSSDDLYAAVFGE